MNFFFITGLPRSKSAWLANFLTYGNTICLHDSFIRCKVVDDMAALMRDQDFYNVGHSDPANLLFQKRLRELLPGAKWVLIHRPFEEVKMAVERAFGIPYSKELAAANYNGMQRLDVRFEDVERRAMEIAEWVAPGFTCPKERLDMLSNMNVQLQRDYVAQGIQRHAAHPLFRKEAA